MFQISFNSSISGRWGSLRFSAGYKPGKGFKFGASASFKTTWGSFHLGLS